MTVYRLAKNPGDYAAAHALAQKENFVKSKMTFPTILALDGGEVVGVLSTRVEDKMIVAGPLVLKSDRRRPRAAIRLSELYDIVMRSMKIETYIFHTEAGSIIDDAVQKLKLAELYASTAEHNFYIRRLS